MTADNRKLTIGVLALQGDYERHAYQVGKIGATARPVRLPEDLKSCDGLIIPGGESTTMNVLIDRFNLRQPLTEFGRQKPVYGTCAGMIMLADEIEDNIAGVEPLHLLDMAVLRNGYGRQIFSFEEDIAVNLDNGNRPLPATFIRAPRVTRLGKDIRVLGRYHDDPVLIAKDNLLASSFHTELGENTRVLTYFVDRFFQ